uniref:Uncharacterized protein n=1 Tax=Arundo donax TaxID=35708 RepID=A0A0A9DY19_ARUDO
MSRRLVHRIRIQEDANILALWILDAHDQQSTFQGRI